MCSSHGGELAGDIVLGMLVYKSPRSTRRRGRWTGALVAQGRVPTAGRRLHLAAFQPPESEYRGAISGRRALICLLGRTSQRGGDSKCASWCSCRRVRLGRWVRDCDAAAARGLADATCCVSRSCLPREIRGTQTAGSTAQQPRKQQSTRWAARNTACASAIRLNITVCC